MLKDHKSIHELSAYKSVARMPEAVSIGPIEFDSFFNFDVSQNFLETLRAPSLPGTGG